MSAIAVALALCGCSPGGPGANKETAQKSNASPATISATANPPAASAATTGGDGSAIVLSGLSLEEIEAAKLEGELSCGFAASNTAPMLLVAMGDVASKTPSQGVVKVADSVERVAAPGGFDGMLENVVFTGAGKTLRVVVTGPPIGDSESPPQPATLTYQRADGASRTFVGQWTCGP